MRSNHTRLYLVALAGAILMAPLTLPAAEPTLWRYTHPKTEILVGIEWQRVMHSPLGAKLRAELEKSPFKSYLTGDLLAKVNRILVSAPSLPTPVPGQSPADSAKLAKETDALVAIEGTLTLDDVRGMAGKGVTTEEHAGVPLLLRPSPKGGQDAVALISARTLLIGRRALVEQVIDEAARPQSRLATNDVFQSAAELAGRNAIWIAARMDPAKLQAAKGAALPPGAKDIRGIQMGMSFNAGLDLEVGLETVSAEKATQMAGMIDALAQLAATQKEQKPQLVELLNRLSVKTDGTMVRASLNIQQQSLERDMAKLQGEVMAGLLNAKPGEGELAAAGASPATEPPAPPKKMVIRISGLDGGDREIPFSKKP